MRCDYEQRRKGKSIESREVQTCHPIDEETKKRLEMAKEKEEAAAESA